MIPHSNSALTAVRRSLVLLFLHAAALLQPDTAIAEDLGPAPRLAAEEGVEFRRRRGHRIDAGLVEAVECAGRRSPARL